MLFAIVVYYVNMQNGPQLENLYTIGNIRQLVLKSAARWHWEIALSCLQSSSIRGLIALWMILLHIALSSTALKMSCNPIPVRAVMLRVKVLLLLLLLLLW